MDDLWARDTQMPRLFLEWLNGGSAAVCRPGLLRPGGRPPVCYVKGYVMLGCMHTIMHKRLHQVVVPNLHGRSGTYVHE